MIYHISYTTPAKKISYNIFWRGAITREREMTQRVVWSRLLCVVWTHNMIYHISYTMPAKKIFHILYYDGQPSLERWLRESFDLVSSVWEEPALPLSFFSPPSLPRKLKADLFSPITSKTHVCWQSYSRYQVLSRLDLLQNTHLYPKTGCDCMEEGNVATRSNAPWSTPTSTNSRPYALSYGTLGAAGVALTPPSNPYLAQLWPLIQVSLQCSGPCGGL